MAVLELLSVCLCVGDSSLYRVLWCLAAQETFSQIAAFVVHKPLLLAVAQKDLPSGVGCPLPMWICCCYRTLKLQH